MNNKMWVILFSFLSAIVSWAGDRSDIGVGCPKDPATGERYHESWCEPQGGVGGAGESSQGGSGHGDFGHGDLAGGDKSGAISKSDTPEGLAQKAEDERIKKEKWEVWHTKQREEIDCSNKEVIAFRKARDDGWKALNKIKQDLADAKVQVRDTQSKIATLTQQVREKLELPQVTAQIEKEASEYFKAQLSKSESLASDVENGLEQGLSVHAAKLMVNFALDTVTTIDSFLAGLCSGFANGFYETALTATQAAEVVFRNPSTLLHLSDNLMYSLTSYQVLDTFKYSLVSMAETMASGSAHEKGEVIGGLSTLLIFTVGSLETNTVGKFVLEDIAGEVISSEVAEELTSTLVPRIKVSGLASEEISVLEKAAGTSFEVTPYLPSGSGFIGKTERITLQPGQLMDRYGGTMFSRYFSPIGTPLEARSIPPQISNQPLRKFEVLKPIEAETGRIAPACGQFGFGIQYKTDLNLHELISNGFLREVFN
ncbi:MAG: glycohydrolase toxin TNT-related protein [Bdellovibrionia bacterium]